MDLFSSFFFLPRNKFQLEGCMSGSSLCVHVVLMILDGLCLFFASCVGFQYMGTVDCIVAEPGDYTSALSLSALIHALYEKESVAVVRYVKRKNSNPLFGILTPLIKPDVECLYFNQLPYVEVSKRVI